MSDVAPQTAQKHAALVWVIRGTSVVIETFVVICLLGILAIGSFGVFFKAITDVSNPSGYRITMVFFALILTLILGFIVKRNYHNFYHKYCKAIWEVNARTVGNLSSVFALLLAIDWHHVLPANFPYAIIHYFGRNSFLAPLLEPGDRPGIHYRGILAIIAFYVFFKLINAYLMQILDFKSSKPSQNSTPFTPSDPDAPEFPQKSPLIPL